MKTHYLKTKYRTAKMEVTEKDSCIEFHLSFDKYGVYDDMNDVDKWLHPIFMEYEKDPRPTAMIHPLTGERAMVKEAVVAGSRVAMVEIFDAPARA